MVKAVVVYLSRIGQATYWLLLSLIGAPDWDLRSWPHCNNQAQCWYRERSDGVHTHSWCRCRCPWCLCGKLLGKARVPEVR